MDSWSLKAFTCDFDGTLYAHQTHAIGDEDVAAIRSFQQAGCLFGVCGGRPPGAIMLQAGHLIGPDFFISVSGALVTDAHGSVIHESRIPYDVVLELRGAYESRSTGFVISAGHDYYTIGRRHHPFIRDVMSMAELPASLYGVTIGMPTSERAMELANEVSERFGGLVEVLHNAASVEVVAKGTSKGHALRKVKHALGVDVMAAMGDADNDVALLEAADVSFTFEGSSGRLVACADMLAKSVASALVDFASRGDLVSSASLVA